jgi:hypothetical protein
VSHRSSHASEESGKDDQRQDFHVPHFMGGGCAVRSGSRQAFLRACD